MVMVVNYEFADIAFLIGSGRVNNRIAGLPFVRRILYIAAIRANLAGVYCRLVGVRTILPSAVCTDGAGRRSSGN